MQISFGRQDYGSICTRPLYQHRVYLRSFIMWWWWSLFYNEIWFGSCLKWNALLKPKLNCGSKYVVKFGRCKTQYCSVSFHERKVCAIKWSLINYTLRKWSFSSQALEDSHFWSINITAATADWWCQRGLFSGSSNLLHTLKSITE